MLVTRTFNKVAPVVDTPGSDTGVIFTATGVNSLGLSLWLENTHSLNTLVYYFEESADGVTWERMEFANGGESNEFALIAATVGSPLQGTVQIKLIPLTGNTRIRMRAYGDTPIFVGISHYTPTNTSTTGVSITL